MKMDFKVLETNVTYKFISFTKLILMEWLQRVFHQYPNLTIKFLLILLAYYNIISFCGLGEGGHSARYSEVCLFSLSQQHGLKGILMLIDTMLCVAQTWSSSHNRKRLRSKTIAYSWKSIYNRSHILVADDQSTKRNCAAEQHNTQEPWKFYYLRLGVEQSLQLVNQVLAQLCI